MTIIARGALALAAFGGLALAACGSSSTSSTTPAGGGSNTVAVRTVAGTGKVLTAADGHTLYISQQEAVSGKPLCTSSECTSFWMPLTVTKGKQPSAPSGVSVTLSTVTRPDGSRQVTLNGAPLYTFSVDHSAGQVKGNGFRDSFNGVHFTWHAATTSGAITSGASSSSSPDGGY